MHDPMTVAFEFPTTYGVRCFMERLPKWFRRITFYERWKYYTLLTIWHVDPECDGSDDSCGWSFPRLTKDQRSNLKHLAWCEARYPWFCKWRGKQIRAGADAESLLRGAFVSVAKSLRVRVPDRQIEEWARWYIHNPHDNFRSTLAFLPGYHSNFENDTPDREDHAMGLFCSLARIILRWKRPWYRHPKWHIHHWKFQLHPLLKFKRWAFSRCCKCGKGFRYGEAPVSGNWDSTGPLWFKSEENIYHSDCSKPGDSCCASAEALTA